MTTFAGVSPTAAPTDPLTCPGDSDGASATRRLRSPCLCGGEIVSLSTRDGDVRGAVELHQASLLHRAWRRRRDGD